MNKEKEQLITGLYCNWCEKQFNMDVEEEKMWCKIKSILPNVKGTLRIKQEDLINDYGSVMEKKGFIAGFDTAIKLLIGGENNV